MEETQRPRPGVSRKRRARAVEPADDADLLPAGQGPGWQVIAGVAALLVAAGMAIGGLVLIVARG